MMPIRAGYWGCQLMLAPSPVIIAWKSITAGMS